MALIGFEPLILLLLILANGVFAMAEIALVAARRARLRVRAERGDAGARAALELAAAPNRFLSTVQIGITLVGVLAGAYGGATVAEGLAARLRAIPPLAPYSGPLALGAVVLSITYLSLVIGELVPKRLALRSPERVAAALARPMRLLSRLAAPAVQLLSLSTDALLRLLRVGPSQEPPVTEEEIKLLLEQGARAGVFAAIESEMVSGVFRLADRRLGSVVTPRPEIVWLDVEDPPEVNRRKVIESGYSRFPVCRGELDHVLGVVQAKDLLARSLAGEPFDLQAVLRTPLYLPESVLVHDALEALREAGVRLALVIDEYGGLQGLVTVTDIVEQVVGQIEPDRPAPVRRADGSWLLDGRMPVGELRELLRMAELPGEGRGLYETLGGLVLSALGRIPSAGERFELGGWRFEVLDMDGRRVDRVLASASPEPPAG